MIISASRIQVSISPVIAMNGLFVLIFGISEWLIGLTGVIFGLKNSIPFLISGTIVNGIGFTCYYLLAESLRPRMSMRQVLLAIISFWFSAPLVASLPFIIGTTQLSFSFAYFECVSALTTTGSSVMVGLDTAPRTILFWRSLLHWYGGLGVVIAAMMMFPALRLGGMQFFLRPGYESVDKILPSVKQLGYAITGAYATFTLACAIFLMLADVPAFDAINHAMSTMATGGMAVKDSGFFEYSNPAKFIDTVFMLCAGMPLILQLRFLRGEYKVFFTDQQARGFLSIYAVLAFLVTAYHIFHNHPDDQISAMVDTTFNVATIITGTGFSDGDFQAWGAFPTAIIFMCIFIGGCTGSTSGAIKIFRFQVLFELIRVQIKKILFPHAITKPQYDGRPLDPSTIESVVAFFLLYIGTYVTVASALAISGLGFLESISAAACSLGNVGPALGPVLGPVGNFSSLSNLQLAILDISMNAGRLEVMVMMVLFLPRFWRH